MIIEKAKKIEPIMITLTNQNEIDKLHAILNSPKLTRALDMQIRESRTDWGALFTMLDPIKSDRADVWHEKIIDLINP